VDHLTAAPVLVEYFDARRAEWGDLAVVSPDVGNVKVANMYADHLHAELAIIDKRRQSSLSVATRSVVGDVSGRTVLMIDDMISTGGTLCEAASIVMEQGAVDVICAATHPVLIGPAVERLAESPISRIIITDTIPNQRRFEGIEDKLTRLSVGRLFGAAGCARPAGSPRSSTATRKLPWRSASTRTRCFCSFGTAHTCSTSTWKGPSRRPAWSRTSSSATSETT
jgi:ribose-phosphate pyrophosphokinase